MYTLWIFDSDGDDLIEDGNEIRVNEIQLQSHRWNYGRIYVLSLRGILHAVHFTSVSRENEWLGYTYYLKRTKEIDVKELSLHECGVFGINNDGVLVCRFLDKRWW
jgi:predicted DNA-binding transcriptional regulator